MHPCDSFLVATKIPSKSLQLGHLFMSFSLRKCMSRKNGKSVYPGKNGRCLSGQVYYTKNYKILLFTNRGHRIRGGNDKKLTRQ